MIKRFESLMRFYCCEVANFAELGFDIEVLKKNTITYRDQLIKKIEWHAVNGIDEVVLKYIQTELKNNGIPLDKFQVILY